MESLAENRPLLYSLAGAGTRYSIYTHCTQGGYLSIVDFPQEFRSVLVQVREYPPVLPVHGVQVLAVDAVAALLCDRVLLALAGEGRLAIRI